MLVPDYLSFLAGDRNFNDLVVVLVVEPHGPLSALKLEIEACQLPIGTADLDFFFADWLECHPHREPVLGHDRAERYGTGRALDFPGVILAVLSQVAP